MLWCLERGDNRLVCEIRCSDDDGKYEFELAKPGHEPETQRFESPSQLIDTYLKRQSALQAEGWRPRVVEVPMFS
jgi:hypothetical protein